MRIALAAAGLLLLAACSSTTAPASAPDGTTSSTSTTTTAAPTKLAPLWENRLPAVSPRGMCPAEATFTSSCLTAILDFQEVVEEISDQADALGGRYTVVESATARVNDAIEEWTSTCVTSDPNTSERIGCLNPLNRIMTADAAIMSAIHEVESP